MLSRTCIIQRPQFGFMIQKRIDSALSGSKSRTQTEVQQVAANHHELRLMDGYYLYCIYCAEMATQLEWRTTILGGEHAGE